MLLALSAPGAAISAARGRHLRLSGMNAHMCCGGVGFEGMVDSAGEPPPTAGDLVRCLLLLLDSLDEALCFEDLSR